MNGQLGENMQICSGIQTIDRIGIGFTTFARDVTNLLRIELYVAKGEETCHFIAALCHFSAALISVIHLW